MLAMLGSKNLLSRLSVIFRKALFLTLKLVAIDRIPLVQLLLLIIIFRN